jgi:hypothetical protein
MKNFMAWSLAAAVFAIPLFGATVENDDDLPVAKTKVKTVAAFKNGLAFVFRAGETRLSNGWARLEELPAATLGSFWVGTTSQNGPITDLVVYRGKQTQNVDAINLGELLAANVGREVVVTYLSGSQPKEINGTILTVPENRKPAAATLPVPHNPYYPGSFSPATEMPGEIVAIQNRGGGISVLNKNAILSLELAGNGNLKTHLEKEVPRAKILLAGKPASAEITLACLEKGIIWSPSYRVNIENDKQADIALDAVLADDVEDLDAADISFVVGHPNFLYADVLSPLSLQQSVAGFVQALMSGQPHEGYNQYRNVMSQAMSNRADFVGEARPDMAYSAQSLPGEANEDLYFYHQSHVTLKKGERARFSVFSGKVPYEHAYQWDIPDTMGLDDRGYRQDRAQHDEELHQVWHVLRLENTSRQPWTTAPAFAVNGTMPIAQDILKYTPAGGKNTLKLTVATDISVDPSQTETRRNTVGLLGRSFDQVGVAGKLRVKNWKSTPIKMAVKKSLAGEVAASTANGKVTKVAKKLTAVNPDSEIQWEFTLDGGGEKELTYEYTVLISR